MNRVLLVSLSVCAFALAPSLSASAMPVPTPGSLGGSDAAIIQVKGGVTVTVIWGGAAEVIITDGAEDGGIITAGGIIATNDPSLSV